MKQEYLGDGVYVTVNRDFVGQIILTTGHHEPKLARNVIHLEPAMLSRASTIYNADVETYPKEDVNE